MISNSKGHRMGGIVEALATEVCPAKRLEASGDVCPGTKQGPGTKHQPEHPLPGRTACAALVTGCLAMLLLLSGCGSFFAKDTSTGTTGTGTTTTGDYLYVANANTSLNTIAGFSLTSGTGTLALTSNSPYDLGVLPTTVAMTPSNSFLYVGTEVGGIYVYSVSSTGALTIGNSGSAVAAAAPTSMVVDSTGQWLLALQDGGTAPLITVFSINTSTGALTTGSSVSLDTGSSGSLLLVPNSTLLYATLGTGGVDALTFVPATGVLTKLNVLLNTRGSAYADQQLASDGTYLFVTETGTNGVRSFTINADGNLSELAGSPTATGLGVGAILEDSTDSYLYVANSAAGTISAFAIDATTGALTAITGSPFTTGTSPSSLVEDNSAGYVAVTCTGGTPDLQIFSISTTTPGALVAATTASTGSVSPAGAYAVVATK